MKELKAMFGEPERGVRIMKELTLQKRATLAQLAGEKEDERKPVEIEQESEARKEEVNAVTDEKGEGKDS